MSNPLPEVPSELLPLVGHALSGWKHLTDAASSNLPTNLHRANLVRRGAIAFLTKPPKRPAK